LPIFIDRLTVDLGREKFLFYNGEFTYKQALAVVDFI